MSLVPFVGSKPRNGEMKGSTTVVLHGCCVPIVLESVDEGGNRWTVVGDCYVEGVMHGEAVTCSKVQSRSPLVSTSAATEVTLSMSPIWEGTEQKAR